MIKLVVIRSFKMKRFNVIGLLLFIFALASCSQKNAGTNDVVDAAVVPTDADSVVLANPVPKLADTIAVDSAEIDSFVAEDVIVKDSLEYGGERYRRLKFKIKSPLNQHYEEVDSIACSFNNWNYAPDAVYEVNITEFFDGEEVVAYRNGIKVMESREGEGEFRSYSETYYYSDGSVADYKDGRVIDGKEVYFETSNTLSLFLSEDDQYFFVHLHKDTLSISEVVDYFSEEVINREVYLVADEGTPVPEIVVKAIKSERQYCEKLEKIKFVKKIER
jgi:hypothetical protein